MSGNRRIMTEPCADCGRTGKTYHGLGLCTGCYSRQRRTDPAAAESCREYARQWKRKHREQNRARDREFAARPDVRGNCTTCGGLMGIGVKETGTCAGCIAERHELRWQRIETMWAAGEQMKAIAAALGTTVDALSVDFHLMRAAGRNLPYRYRGYGSAA